MNYYYIPTPENGYEQVEESVFMSMVSNKQCGNYARKVYRGEIDFASVPEEHREKVQMLVNETIAKSGKYEDKQTSPIEIGAIMENIYGTELTKGEVKRLFSGIEKLRDGATDAVASTAVSVYPRLKEDSSLIPVGTRINWNGIIKKAAVDIWDTAENNPDNAPTLWEDINYREGYRIIHETITATTAFAKDECGWWDGVLYRSLIDSNVHTPVAYPAGWEKVN